MKLGRDKSGSLFLYAISDPHRTCRDDWDNDNMLFVKNPGLSEYDAVTWEGGLVECHLEEDPNGKYWLARDKNGCLRLHDSKPYRNSVNPWWSSPDNMFLTNSITVNNPDFIKKYPQLYKDNDPADKQFSNLTWEDEPLSVKIII